MASVLSNYAGNLALATLLNGAPVYLALHTADPTVTGLPGTEVAGGGYARQRITFSAASSKTVTSTNAIDFPGMPACTVTYLAVWNATSSGNMIYSFALDTPIVVSTDGEFLAAAGDIALSL